MSILGLLSMDSHSLSGLSMCQVIPVHPVACKKNKKSALWLALYRLLWCLITLVATRSSFLHFCSMIVAGPAHHGLVMRLRTACCGFCKHSLLRCYSWCMLFGGVSELIVVQCLGYGTDLPLVATPSSALDRFAFGHGCLTGILATYCIWALWQSQQPHLGYQLGLRGPSGYRSLRTQERCPGLRCCLTSGYGNQLHAGACRAGTRDGHARVLPSPVPLIFPAGFYF